MSRNQWEDALQSILTGGLQGYQTGQASNQEIQKTLMLERLKQGIKQNSLQDTISRIGTNNELRPKGISGEGDLSYEFIDPVEREGKTLQNKISQAILEDIEASKTSPTGESGMTYRRGDTGEMVDPETAKIEIAQGNRDFLITKKKIGKYGVSETPVAKPPDLTKEEKDYLIAGKRIKASINNLQNIIYPRLNKLQGSKDWQAFQAQKLPFWAIRDQDIEDFKSEITRLKADIPFLRGGKQLTPTESKRIDLLLNPFGKSDKTKLEDLKRFEEEFTAGEELMVGGITALKPKPLLSKPMPDESIIKRYMKKYPLRSRDEIVQAIQRLK